MSAVAGPGPVQATGLLSVPEGWEVFFTCDPSQYYGCFARPYFYCRSEDRVQWEMPSPEDARAYEGQSLNGKVVYEMGDEFIPPPPPPIQYSSMISDKNYVMSVEDPEDMYDADEDLLKAAMDADLDKVKKCLGDGGDITVLNWPWQNTALHLANIPPFWDAETISKEIKLRQELTENLVRLGSDVEAENIFHLKAIDMAAFHGYEGTVAFLKDKGCKFGWFGAAFAGDLPRIIELLEQGVDIDMKGRYGRTAFAEAHLRGNWAVESFLAQQGCSRELPHKPHLKFNPGGGAAPQGNSVAAREIEHHREDYPEWYDNMMERRFPGYLEKIAHAPQMTAN